MGIIVGSLGWQNWHRQVRQMNLGPVEAFDHVFAKTAEAGKTFGFRPMALDCDAESLGADGRAFAGMKDRFEANDMIAIVGLGAVAIANDAEVRRRSVAHVREQLAIAADFGARTASFYFARNGRVTRAGQVNFAILMLKEIGCIARDYGIRICTENYDFFTADELIRICDETALANVGIQSDTGNWLILGEDPVEATRKCLPYTFHAHVRDYVLENDTYNGVAVGTGLVDLARILPLLARAGEEEDIVFSVEVDTDDRDEDRCAHDSFAFLKTWLVANGHSRYLSA